MKIKLVMGDGQVTDMKILNRCGTGEGILKTSVPFAFPIDNQKSCVNSNFQGATKHKFNFLRNFMEKLIPRKKIFALLIKF